jgi:hypothetical protein
LRCGGLFAGHDFEFMFYGADQDWGVCGNGTRIEGSVKRAVLEFAKKNKIQLIQLIQQTGEKLYKSWYFFKNC